MALILGRLGSLSALYEARTRGRLRLMALWGVDKAWGIGSGTLHRCCCSGIARHGGCRRIGNTTVIPQKFRTQTCENATGYQQK